MTDKKLTKKDIPLFLVEWRNKMILELNRQGLSNGNIALIFSIGITRQRIFQIIKEKPKKNVGLIN